MYPPVHPQLRPCRERLVTRLALPLQLPRRVRVAVGVVFEAVARREAGAAGGADERALEGVSGAHVVLEVGLLEKAHAAVGAGVGAVARMGFLVGFEGGGVGKGFRAEGALVGAVTSVCLKIKKRFVSIYSRISKCEALNNKFLYLATFC